MEIAWFFLFISSICLEGLGRKYAPSVPSGVFYFFKDAVLILGYLILRPSAAVRRSAKWLFRGFSPWWMAAFGWTVIEMFNSSSMALALIGLRAYWLWWLTPLVVATALGLPKVRRRAVF